MLASLLPGLRDVRTPLAVGYLWLLNLWLFFGHYALRGSNADSRTWEAVIAAYEFLGQGAAIAAVSFTAFLVGAILTIDFESKLLSRLSFMGVRARRLDTEGQLEDFISTALEGVDASRRSKALEWNEMLPADDLRARLLVANQEMYGEYDRLESEATFRINVAPPLLVLGIAIAPLAGDSLLGTLLIPVPMLIALLLTLQSFRKHQLAVNVLMRAVLSGVIEHSVIARARALHERQTRTTQQEQEDARNSEQSKSNRKFHLNTLAELYELQTQLEVSITKSSPADPNWPDLLKRKSEMRDSIAAQMQRLSEAFDAG
ncbi:hypothetical protein [Kribbella endophytica]